MILKAVNFYLILYVVVLIAGIASVLIRVLCQKNLLRIKCSSELKLNYLFLCVCLILPFLSFSQSEIFQFRPVVKIESAQSMKDFDSSWQRGGGSSVSLLSQSLPTVQIEEVFSLAVGFVLISTLLGLGKILIDVTKLVSLIGNSYPIRKIGSVRISASDQVLVPFSARVLSSWVLIPVELISQREAFKVSVLHELQHHRQRDTTFIYLLLFVRAFLLLNPVMWIWSKSISEVQEMACDENLIVHGKINREAYAGRLIEIAETAIGQEGRLVCAAGLGFLNDRQTLSRRIETMFQKEKSRRRVTKLLGATVLLVMTGTAFAARELVLDRRVTMIEAQKMAEIAKRGSEFPIVVNDLVLGQLNRFLGTEEGRHFIKASMERMKVYQPMIEAKLVQYNAPKELMAIALVESGYKNLPQSPNKSWGAGLWMFIESTAKRYGMRVDSVVDERLNPEVETDAAMRYLTSNNLWFSDWLLAIQAYNTGENTVQKAIDSSGTKDVWTLIRAGLPTDKDYLARVMAVVLILKNPEILN